MREDEQGVELRCLDVRTRNEQVLRARRLVLACGTLGTARIMLRSFAAPGARLGVLTNAYTYLTCLLPGMF